MEFKNSLKRLYKDGKNEEFVDQTEVQCDSRYHVRLVETSVKCSVQSMISCFINM